MMRMLVRAVLVVLPLLAHAQTNYPIVQKLNAVIVKGVQAPAIVRHFIINGLEPATSTPAALQQLIATDLQLWRKVIRDANISARSL